MCTAISFKTKDHYFGRTLDVDFNYGQNVVITPRDFKFDFKHKESIINHYAIIGMGLVQDDFPLYFDATNEKGLSMAGLRFAGNAIYCDYDQRKDNIATFEFIPWILSQCDCVNSAKEFLEKINLTKDNFSDIFSAEPLHWIISDSDQSITVECVADGLKVYYNPVKVLTNNPDFPLQVFNLNNYMGLTAGDPQDNFSSEFEFNRYSRGMGALGLPGDYSSMSRFVKVAFINHNSYCGESENESVTQFFHILSSVEMPMGCVKTDKGYDFTAYTSCCNTDKGVYYYTTYDNNQISAVRLYNENLDNNDLIVYNLSTEQNIYFHN